MRGAIVAGAGLLLLAGCQTGSGPAVSRVSTLLSPADAASGLVAGGPVTMTIATVVEAPPEGQDRLVEMTLTAADGRALRFTEANHAPFDVMAQAPGGPLAQAMSLFGDEAPTLYAAAGDHAAPFLCDPSGPAYLGVYRGPDNVISIVGLSQGFSFETLDGGGYAPLPFSPDQVCARLRFNAQD